MDWHDLPHLMASGIAEMEPSLAIDRRLCKLEQEGKATDLIGVKAELLQYIYSAALRIPEQEQYLDAIKEDNLFDYCNTSNATLMRYIHKNLKENKRLSHIPTVDTLLRSYVSELTFHDILPRQELDTHSQRAYTLVQQLKREHPDCFSKEGTPIYDRLLDLDLEAFRMRPEKTIEATQAIASRSGTPAAEPRR